jgi:hypothetical protein
MERASPSLIRDLARQTGRSYDEARRAYEEQFAKLEAEATVHTYVPVIARKRAQEVLSRRH